MIFSHIGTLRGKFPYASLGKDPVEFELEDLFIVVELNEDCIVDQTLPLQQKYARLYQMIEEALDNQDQKKSDKDKEKDKGKNSKSAKYMKKAINNLRGQVKNLHFRVQSKVDPNYPFSCGVYLPTMTIDTVRQTGKKVFWTKQLGIPLMKAAKIFGLKTYWNDSQTNFVMGLVSDYPRQSIIQFLKLKQVLNMQLPKSENSLSTVDLDQTPPQVAQEPGYQIQSLPSIQSMEPTLQSETAKKSKMQRFKGFFKKKQKTDKQKEIQRKKQIERQLEREKTKLQKQRKAREKAKEKAKDKDKKKAQQDSSQKQVLEPLPQLQLNVLIELSMEIQLKKNSHKDQLPEYEITANLGELRGQVSNLMIYQLVDSIFFILGAIQKARRSVLINQIKQNTNQYNKRKFCNYFGKIFSKNKKQYKKLSGLPSSFFQSLEDRNKFMELLGGYGLKVLNEFARNFIMQRKMGKKITQAVKTKNNDQINKMLQDMVNQEDDLGDDGDFQIFIQFNLILKSIDIEVINVGSPDSTLYINLKHISFFLSFDQTLNKYFNCVFKIKTGFVDQVTPTSDRRRILSVINDAILLQSIANYRDSTNQLMVQVSKLLFQSDASFIDWLIQFIRFFFKTGYKSNIKIFSFSLMTAPFFAATKKFNMKVNFPLPLVKFSLGGRLLEADIGQLSIYNQGKCKQTFTVKLVVGKVALQQVQVLPKSAQLVMQIRRKQLEVCKKFQLDVACKQMEVSASTALINYFIDLLVYSKGLVSRFFVKDYAILRQKMFNYELINSIYGEEEVFDSSQNRYEIIFVVEKVGISLEGQEVVVVQSVKLRHLVEMRVETHFQIFNADVLGAFRVQPNLNLIVKRNQVEQEDITKLICKNKTLVLEDKFFRELKVLLQTLLQVNLAALFSPGATEKVVTRGPRVTLDVEFCNISAKLKSADNYVVVGFESFRFELFPKMHFDEALFTAQVEKFVQSELYPQYIAVLEKERIRNDMVNAFFKYFQANYLDTIEFQVKGLALGWQSAARYYPVFSLTEGTYQSSVQRLKITSPFAEVLDDAQVIDFKLTVGTVITSVHSKALNQVLQTVSAVLQKSNAYFDEISRRQESESLKGLLQKSKVKEEQAPRVKRHRTVKSEFKLDEFRLLVDNEVEDSKGHHVLRLNKFGLCILSQRGKMLLSQRLGGLSVDCQTRNMDIQERVELLAIQADKKQHCQSIRVEKGQTLEVGLQVDVLRVQCSACLLPEVVSLVVTKNTYNTLIKLKNMLTSVRLDAPRAGPQRQAIPCHVNAKCESAAVVLKGSAEQLGLDFSSSEADFNSLGEIVTCRLILGTALSRVVRKDGKRVRQQLSTKSTLVASGSKKERWAVNLNYSGCNLVVPLAVMQTALRIASAQQKYLARTFRILLAHKAELKSIWEIRKQYVRQKPETQLQMVRRLPFESIAINVYPIRLEVLTLANEPLALLLLEVNNFSVRGEADRADLQLQSLLRLDVFNRRLKVYEPVIDGIEPVLKATIGRRTQVLLALQDSLSLRVNEDALVYGIEEGVAVGKALKEAAREHGELSFSFLEEFIEEYEKEDSLQGRKERAKLQAIIEDMGLREEEEMGSESRGIANRQEFAVHVLNNSGYDIYLEVSQDEVSKKSYSLRELENKKVYGLDIQTNYQRNWELLERRRSLRLRFKIYSPTVIFKTVETVLQLGDICSRQFKGERDDGEEQPLAQTFTVVTYFNEFSEVVEVKGGIRLVNQLGFGLHAKLIDESQAEHFKWVGKGGILHIARNLLRKRLYLRKEEEDSFSSISIEGESRFASEFARTLLNEEDHSITIFQPYSFLNLTCHHLRLLLRQEGLEVEMVVAPQQRKTISQLSSEKFIEYTASLQPYIKSSRGQFKLIDVFDEKERQLIFKNDQMEFGLRLLPFKESTFAKTLVVYSPVVFLNRTDLRLRFQTFEYEIRKILRSYVPSNEHYFGGSGLGLRPEPTVRVRYEEDGSGLYLAHQRIIRMLADEEPSQDIDILNQSSQEVRLATGKEESCVLLIRNETKASLVQYSHFVIDYKYFIVNSSNFAISLYQDSDELVRLHSSELRPLRSALEKSHSFYAQVNGKLFRGVRVESQAEGEDRVLMSEVDKEGCEQFKSSEIFYLSVSLRKREGRLYYIVDLALPDSLICNHLGVPVTWMDCGQDLTVVYSVEDKPQGWSPLDLLQKTRVKIIVHLQKQVCEEVQLKEVKAGRLYISQSIYLTKSYTSQGVKFSLKQDEPVEPGLEKGHNTVKFYLTLKSAVLKVITNETGGRSEFMRLTARGGSLLLYRTEGTQLMLEAVLQSLEVYSCAAELYVLRSHPQNHFFNFVADVNFKKKVVDHIKVAVGELEVSVSDYLSLAAQCFAERIIESVARLTRREKGEQTVGHELVVGSYLRQRNNRTQTGSKGNTVTIVSCVFQQFRVLLTFHQTCNERVDQGFLSDLGKAIFSIENTNLLMERIEFAGLEATPQELFVKAVGNYYKRIGFLILNLLASLNLFGNVGEFKSLFGEGIDSYDSGFLTGTGTLVRNTVAGTANFLHKVTRSLGDSVAVLSLDRKYQAARYTNSRKNPSGIGEGLLMGGKSLVKGLGEGIAGLVVTPYQEGVKGGFLGGLLGTVKGVTGLIAKPVAGLLDATSKSVEGVKSQLLGKELRVEQKTKPEILFFQRQIIRRQSGQEQLALELMVEVLPEVRSEGIVAVLPLDGERAGQLEEILVLTVRRLVLYSMGQRRVVRSVGHQEIIGCAKFSHGVVVYYYEAGEEEEFIISIIYNQKQKYQAYMTIQALSNSFKRKPAL